MLHRLLHHLGATAARTAGSARRRRTCRRLPSSPAAAPRSARAPGSRARRRRRARPRCLPSSGAGSSSGCARRASCRPSDRPSRLCAAVALSPAPSKCSMKRCSASGRRLNTRSSASSRSSAEISAYGVTCAGFTIAASSPACTQWCRKTELSTRARLGRRGRSSRSRRRGSWRRRAARA